VLVAALGYFVDIYDLILFSVIRMKSLGELGLSGEALTTQGPAPAQHADVRHAARRHFVGRARRQARPAVGAVRIDPPLLAGQHRSTAWSATSTPTRGCG
jgi:hypothetical protein